MRSRGFIPERPTHPPNESPPMQLAHSPSRPTSTSNSGILLTLTPKSDHPSQFP
ncbi:hypothetical protein M427DRAFT_58839 [Gonapodya prolifera JEL478]|uniref:Uncharacterized protein n=1 Tax=Gonapodya prolifera (strain JEL478) TaxID=1344416 RepID=A0A139A9H2_GONPJ|nr:hypothetical protein M427DRAFT_58839 [Gonapodya prolifera JEL478]|eukprot:KXS13318.1 hypothetical protein M427DRAFT_58839 [Gonapodya prolifera JEL478]